MQVLQPVKPTLNEMASKLIACAREAFRARKLIGGHCQTLSTRCRRNYTMEQLIKLGAGGKADDTLDYMMLRQMFGLQPKPP
jgi:hypothetical protein